MSEDSENRKHDPAISRRKFLEKFALAGAGGGAGIAIAQMAPPLVAAGGGNTSGVDPPSYTVVNNNGTIQAVNGTTSVIDFSGPNATTIVQDCITTLTSGSVYVKEGVGSLGTLTQKPGVMLMQETEGSFRFLNGSLAVGTKAGVPADTDFGIAVDGLIELNTSNGLVYQRIAGLWGPLAASQVFGQSSGTNPIVVYDVPSLTTALANIANGQRIVILPGIYNIGTTTLQVGTSGQNLNAAQVFGVVDGPMIGQPTGASINYNGTGTAVKINANLGGAGATFMKSIAILQTSSTQQGNGLELAGSWNLSSIEDVLVYNFANGFYFSSANLAAGTGGSQWNRFRNLNAVTCGYGYRILTGVPINRNIFTECWAQNYSASGIRFDPSGNGQQGGCFGNMWIGGYLAGNGTTAVYGADLNAVSTNPNNCGDFAFFGVDFSNSQGEINVGQPGMHARAIGCTTKHGGDFVVSGSGTCDVISCFETNSGNIISKRYGNPLPSTVPVGPSPFSFPNSVPGANGQYCALIIYWYGGLYRASQWEMFRLQTLVQELRSFNPETLSSSPTLLRLQWFNNRGLLVRPTVPTR